MAIDDDDADDKNTKIEFDANGDVVGMSREANIVRRALLAANVPEVDDYKLFMALAAATAVVGQDAGLDLKTCCEELVKLWESAVRVRPTTATRRTIN
jgi:hypothetical protein